MTYKAVSCEQCGKSFHRPTKRVNEAIRNGWGQYCSLPCQAEHRRKAMPCTCHQCGSDLLVRKSAWDKSNTKHFFCSQGCAAIFNNTGRVHSEQSKENVRSAAKQNAQRKGTRTKKAICIVCGKPFNSRDGKQACSTPCGQILQFGALPLTQEEVLGQLQSFPVGSDATLSSKRVPVRLKQSAVRFFTTWNAAIAAAGLNPNIKYMHKKRLMCRDGHIADSVSERTIDDWLFKAGVRHNRSKIYPGRTRLNCDFYLPDYDIWLEYFGLWRNYPAYDEVVKEKYDIARTHGLKLIGVTSDMLYPVFSLNLNKILTGDMPGIV